MLRKGVHRKVDSGSGCSEPVPKTGVRGREVRSGLPSVNSVSDDGVIRRGKPSYRASLAYGRLYVEKFYLKLWTVEFRDTF